MIVIGKIDAAALAARDVAKELIRDASGSNPGLIAKWHRYITETCPVTDDVRWILAHFSYWLHYSSER